MPFGRILALGGIVVVLFCLQIFGVLDFRGAEAQQDPDAENVELKFDKYAEQCLDDLEDGNDITLPPVLQCADGPILPITFKGAPIPADTAGDSKNFTDKTECDKPPLLDISRGKIGQCVPNSRLQVRQAEQKGVDQKDKPYYALLCRNYIYRSLDDQKVKPEYDDVAMIVYSPRNKKTCFFQRLSDTTLSAFPVSESAFAPQATISGKDIPSPFEAGAATFWDKPKVVKDINCARCHDANPFVRSPYAFQVANGADKLPPRRTGEAYGIVALDHFGKDWKKYHGYFDLADKKLKGEGACVSCHSLGLGFESGNFTDYSAGKLAPNQYDNGFPDTHWMPPGANPGTWAANYDASVKKVQACNADQDGAGCNKTLLH